MRARRTFRDPYEYIRKVEYFYKSDHKGLGPFNNEERFYKKNTGLFPISLFTVQPFEIFFWEMEHRTGIKMVPAIGMIFSLLVGPFAAIILTETKIENSTYTWIYDLIMRIAIGWHCLACPIPDIILFTQFARKKQPLWVFIFWCIVYGVSAGLQIVHLCYIQLILNEIDAESPNGDLDIDACYSFGRDEHVDTCKGKKLFKYQMLWFRPVVGISVFLKLFFTWMIIWYSKHCRVEVDEVELEKHNLIEPEDWHYYVPNEIYGMGFGYWDNYDTPNSQGELQDYYSDLISKGLKVQPPHQDDLHEMFNHATSAGTCPL